MAYTPTGCSGINDPYARSMDSDTAALIEVAKTLGRFAETHREAVFDIACWVAKKLAPAPDCLVDYMYRIQSRPTECLWLCVLVVETRGRDPHVPAQDWILRAAVHITAHAALKNDRREFSVLFENIVRDDSYNCAIKNWIAFLCIDFLADARLSGKTFKVYHTLLDSPDPHVRDSAEFFLFGGLASRNRHCLPEISPILEKASGMIYGIYPNLAGLGLVEYLAKFWRENPGEFAEYVERLCCNNLDTIIYNGREQLVLKTINDMLQSGLLDSDAQRRLRGTRARFRNAENS